MEKKMIAVFGGAFNPPANSHINLAKKILKNNQNIEKVIFVPVSVKYNKQGLASNENRFQMLSEICKNNPKFEVSSIEIDSKRQLYTIETLRLIQEKYKQYEIYFILGTDNLKELETWHEPDKLLKEFKVLVLPRDNDVIEDVINSSKFLKENKNAFVKMENIERIHLSSTQIREKIKNKEDVSDLVPTEIKDLVIKIYS